jgi:hypothetical protein
MLFPSPIEPGSFATTITKNIYNWKTKGSGEELDKKSFLPNLMLTFLIIILNIALVAVFGKTN